MEPEAAQTHLDTLIPVFNELLTRDPTRGIALPHVSGSSTLVIRGPSGSGKSVLASLLALRFHGQSLTAADGTLIFPVSVYFSFAQPWQGIRRYIAEVISKGELDAKATWPFLVSPLSLPGIDDTDGMAFLHRHLKDALGPLRAGLTDRAQSPTEVTDVLQALARGLPGPGNADDFRLPGGQLAYFQPDKMRPEDRIRLMPVIVVDPINRFFSSHDSRHAIAQLFAFARLWQAVLIVTLEDAEERADELNRQLAASVEFESDVAISLTKISEPHARQFIEVIKNRNDQPTFGKQVYRIEKPSHALANVGRLGTRASEQRHPGFMIFRSMHWCLSSYRSRNREERRSPSGMRHLDAILNDDIRGARGMDPFDFLASDGIVLVRGKPGAHKLTFAFNLLVGGLWAPTYMIGRGESKPPRVETDGEHGRNVLLVSFGTETSLQVDRVALVGSLAETDELWYRTPTPVGPDGKPAGVVLSADNHALIQWKVRDGGATHSVGTPPKMEVTEWGWQSKGDRLGSVLGSATDRKLIEVTLKPGHLTAPEFLWAMENLIEKWKPARILLHNTGHLRMRFPELYGDKMLYAALCSLARWKGIMLIITDVRGKGADPKLSYGLASSADYLFELELSGNPVCIAGTASSGRGEAVVKYCVLSITNVRGKNYRYMPHFVTILPEDLSGPAGGASSDPSPGPQKNIMRIMDGEEFWEQHREFPDPAKKERKATCQRGAENSPDPEADARGSANGGGAGDD